MKEELEKLLMESYDRGVADALKVTIETMNDAIIAAVAAEREACAKVCEEVAANKTYHTGHLQEAADECAAAIRGREKA